MKIINWTVMIMLTGMLALAGCSKPKAEAPKVGQVTVDIPKLQAAFASATPELQGTVGEVFRAFRYGEYPVVLANLDRLAQAPGLTDAQKKTVSDVTEQMKQVAAAAPARPAQ